MATIAIGEHFDCKEQQQQQQQQIQQHHGHKSQNSISRSSTSSCDPRITDHEHKSQNSISRSSTSFCDKQYYYYGHDPKSGFCSNTGTYCSVFKLGPHHVIPSEHNLDVASFVLSKLPPQHISETKIALIDSANGSSLTYSHLRRSVLSFAATLQQGLGLRKGDVVLLLLSPNSIHYPAICLGILASGAIITPADPLSTCAHVAEQVRESGAKIAISAPMEAHKVEATGIPILMTTTGAHPPQTGLWPLLTVEELMEWGDALEAPLGMGTTQSDVAALLYIPSTSSTGKSKSKGELVTLTHGDLISVSTIIKWKVETESSLAAPASAAEDQDEVFLCLLPMSYAFLGLSLLCVGSTTVIMSGQLHVREMMEAVEKHRISDIMNMAVPLPVLLLAMNRNSGGQNLSLLRRVSTMGGNAGGAQMGARVGKEFRRTFPWVVLMEGYGNGRMTRVWAPTTVFASEKEAQDRSGSVGQLLPQLEGRVVEVKSGRAVGPGAVGELWLRGPQVIKGGYSGHHQDEDAKKGTATTPPADEGDDGWLRTGDLAYFDKDGFLYIVDRIKDLTKHNGLQMSPAELEAALVTHPQILDAAVIPITDQKGEQVSMAYVVRSSAGSNLTCEEIIQFVATQVAPYKKIDKVAFTDAIPRSATGSILRKQLAAQNPQAIPAKL